MSDTERILEVNHVVKVFPGVKALSDANLCLHKGEVLGLIGENGAGKSTMMNILLGSLRPDGGEIMFKGQPYHPESPEYALRQGISMIHQEPTLVPELTIEENTWLGRESRFSKLGYLNVRARLKATEALLAELHIPLDATAVAADLTAAEMQLTELARAVSYDADVVIMDEPTSSFTSQETELLFEIIRTLKSRGVAVIFISHKLDEVLEICDTITVFRDGSHIATIPAADATNDRLISLMVGREVADLYPKQAVEIGEPIFAVKRLSRTGYFEDISFEVRRGEILGFCGLVGAGRSEIMECIFGIERATSGEIYLNGKQLRIRNTLDATRNRIAMVTEDRLRRGLIHELPVIFNMSLAYLPGITRFGFIDFKRRKADCSSMRDLMRVKISDFDQPAGTLSGGNQQKVILGKWLLNSPDVLILDEPTRGIDVGAKAEIYHLIGELAAQGKAILMVSSELPELMGICDRIIVISGGRQEADIPRAEFDKERIMKYAFQNA